MKPWITVKDVQKRIDGFEMGPIDIEFQPGTITALIGTNGAGKSTFCKMLMRIVKQDAGEIRVFNTDTRNEVEIWKQHIAYQPQNPIGYGIYTGTQLRTFLLKWYPKWDEKLFQMLVDDLHIPLDKIFDQLSQGAQQKLLFALTIARGADILLLDEPTAHMDIPSKKVVIDTLVEWMDEKERMIIISSHQIDDIRKLSDYLCVLHDGEVMGVFEKEELHASHKQYWFRHPLPEAAFPGELLRQDNTIISEHAEATEAYCAAQDIQWERETHIDLEEIITLLLTKKQARKE